MRWWRTGEATHPGSRCAELLAAAGLEVSLVVAAVAVGEAIHQYLRNVYLERLYRAGVRIEHHLELVRVSGGRAHFRNLFAPEIEVAIPADVVVLALGRVPVGSLAAELRGREACGSSRPATVRARGRSRRRSSRGRSRRVQSPRREPVTVPTKAGRGRTCPAAPVAGDQHAVARYVVATERQVERF